MPTVAFHTLGCKLNFAETSTVGRQFREKGYSVVEFEETADVILINTCSVTENADREARKLVRQARRRSPEAFVIVMGCYAQLRPEQIAAIDGVDLILGSQEKFRVFDYVESFDHHGEARICVGALDEEAAFGPAYAADSEGRARAFLKVQDGCDYSCAFCTIPMARGASRSQSVASTVQQARDILARGFHEIVLSGVNVGDYGSKIDTSFERLLAALLAVEGEYRIRISSIEPNLLTDRIIELTAASARMCRHFHIPLQSGSASVLRLMRRRYTKDLYAERISTIRDRMPDCAIGIDVIVGHPGETEADFEETYRFLADLPFSYLHVFSYSARPGTHALQIGSPVPSEERARRSAMLRILSEKKRQAFYRDNLGSIRPVLFEHTKDGITSGFTDNYVRVGVASAPDAEHRLIAVRLDAPQGAYVAGSIVDEKYTEPRQL